ncbi:MAG: NAD+ synthase [Candidatus Latescibacterota bacterium]|nr:MAG: NAD+ synthase [Candidatus Latescibacterota bacterium]
MSTFRIALAQMNATVGDLEGNAEKVLRFAEEAREAGADLVAFPELALTGYPPEDLLLKPSFIEENIRVLEQLVPKLEGIVSVVGFVDKDTDIYNAAAVVADGKLEGVYHKTYLPNYGVFDEYRYFRAGSEYPVFVLNGVTFGVNICEDIWYPEGPMYFQSLQGDADFIVNISASPYHMGKGYHRERMLATRASDNLVIVAFVNMVGGQDELVFDGHSLVFDERGEKLGEGTWFEEELLVVDLPIGEVFRTRLHDPRRRRVLLEELDGNVPRISLLSPKPSPKPPISPPRRKPPGPEEEVYRALVLGTRDYVHKNGFSKVVVGLSGGIDSSLTAVIAVDALGPENVVGVAMPSQYSSEASVRDAREVAENLGIRFLVLPIQDVFEAYIKALSGVFEGLKPDVAEENVQARIRGNLLMALSNKFGWLVLTTGNKSEVSVGYCTLYGDMAGGFGVLKDVPKTLVYRLAEYRNRIGERPVIPRSVLEKPPSAELRPGQKDTDTLPPYEVLDPIIEAYIEHDRSPREIVEMGMEEEIVRRVVQMVDRNEYKRRQAPPGVKITPRAFGKDWRLPITNRFGP